jgi:hypothetical protein
MKKIPHSQALEIRNERDLLFLALSSHVAGGVEWFRGKAGYSVGICRENAPCGGIVLVKYDNAFVSAQYFEQWKPITYRNAELLQSEDSMALRELAERISQVILRRQSPVAAAV